MSSWKIKWVRKYQDSTSTLTFRAVTEDDGQSTQHPIDEEVENAGRTNPKAKIASYKPGSQGHGFGPRSLIVSFKDVG